MNRREGKAAWLKVTCWCERKVVTVTPAMINKGLTESCGRKGCHK